MRLFIIYFLVIRKHLSGRLKLRKQCRGKKLTSGVCKPVFPLIFNSALNYTCSGVKNEEEKSEEEKSIL